MWPKWAFYKRKIEWKRGLSKTRFQKLVFSSYDVPVSGYRAYKNPWLPHGPGPLCLAPPRLLEAGSELPKPGFWEALFPINFPFKDCSFGPLFGILKKKVICIITFFVEMPKCGPNEHSTKGKLTGNGAYQKPGFKNSFSAQLNFLYLDTEPIRIRGPILAPITFPYLDTEPIRIRGPIFYKSPQETYKNPHLGKPYSSRIQIRSL